MNALWWWIDRWRKSTAYTDMTLEEQGAYRNLLDEATLRGGPLPLDERVLAKACGDPAKWKRVRPKVMSHFYQVADGWRNETLDSVLARSEELRVARVEAGRQGGLAKASNASFRASKHPSKDPSKPLANDLANTLAKTWHPDPDPDLVRTSPHGDETRARGHNRGIGLMKPHGNVAFDSPRVYVPWKLHFKLLGFRNNPNAEQELQAFYATVSTAWNTGGEHAHLSTGAEMFAFWEARYNEQWPLSKLQPPSADEVTIQRNKAKYGRSGGVP